MVTVELLRVIVWVFDFFFAVPDVEVDFEGTVVGVGAFVLAGEAVLAAAVAAGVLLEVEWA